MGIITERKLLDTSLGFAGGVMAAASYWSLLAPAIEMAEDSKLYGQNGEYSFFPVALGFLIGALFVYGTDLFISSLGVHSPNLVLGDTSTYKNTECDAFYNVPYMNLVCASFLTAFSSDSVFRFGEGLVNSNPLSRRRVMNSSSHKDRYSSASEVQELVANHKDEGLAVGVGFGAIGNSPAATFENA
ncbi:hypothetical protein Cfor_09228, partial [Coptotermes formosanus]